MPCQGACLLADGSAVGRHESHGHLLAADSAVAVVKSQRHVHLGLREVGGERRRDIMVAYGRRRRVQQLHVAEYAAHAEHVLTLQIRSVAPAHHLHGQSVLSRTQILGDVKLRHIVGSLRIAGLMAVHPHCRGRVYAAEVQDGAAVGAKPSVRHGKRAHIRSHGVYSVVGAAVVEARTSLDIRRGIGVRILHVAVYRLVISVHLPV